MFRNLTEAFSVNMPLQKSNNVYVCLDMLKNDCVCGGIEMQKRMPVSK